jgi:hypothetical protein
MLTFKSYGIGLTKEQKTIEGNSYSCEKVLKVPRDVDRDIHE